ncbi:MAG TPA: MarR family transcriptional regulator [Nonomuraea sp.]|nr:MarR family transcriptional regulator [Nonomuraea sp.]
MPDTADRPRAWTFLTNYALVLALIARHPNVRIRDIAATIGLSERAAQRIVTELREAGYVRCVRDGRRNRYEIIPGGYLRHPTQTTVPVQRLIDLLSGLTPADPQPPTPPTSPPTPLLPT